MSALGRLVPPNFDHVASHPLSAITLPTPKPVTIATNWYTAFDSPVQLADGSWHLPDVSRGADLGTVRGGHCTCLVQLGAVKALDPRWWGFYNQGPEGACEGFGHAKAKTLEDRILYDGFWLYNEARRLEGNTGEGTTSVSLLKVLQTIGIRRQAAPVASHDESLDGPVEKAIAAYRWTKDAEEVCAALGRPGAQAVPLSNNWGHDYPQIVWLPVATLARLLAEEGEADVLTDA
jgi:hypothetical protein